MSSKKPHILMMGQTPPPWHGQAVATQLLFEHDWPDFEVHRLRMEYSEEMLEVGRLQWKKVVHLFHLIKEARRILNRNPGCVLFYPPASAKWVPFLRDVVFLNLVRPRAEDTVFIFHASGLPVFARAGLIRRVLAWSAYRNADVSLEVAREKLTPHEAFGARMSKWCPCAIEVPERERRLKNANSPLTVLFVGSLQEGKGVVEILRTAAVLKQLGLEHDFRFRVVGKWFSSEFEQNIQHLRELLEVESMVELTGQLTGDAKWDAYYTADIFFFPTHYESEATPIVIMEALGAGLPIVSTEWAGIPAMLEGCTTSRLLPIKSPEHYAEAILSLKEELDKGIDFAADSKQFYSEHFLPARFIERVADAFLTATADVNVSGKSISPSAESKANARAAPDIDRGDMSDDDKRTPDNGTRPARDSTPITDHSALGTTSSLPSSISNLQSPISLSVYLADQNPGHDRSFGISRMSQVVLDALLDTGRVQINTISSRTSQQAPERVAGRTILPWGTRRKSVRLLTDHLHPLFVRGGSEADVQYFPKGYLPLFNRTEAPLVVTIHDTIIQYDEDHYPDWRRSREYSYWSLMLKHTLRKADRIMTVSESSKKQIMAFMDRHGIQEKEIVVTYEPCLYERIEQPLQPEKDNYVIHLASCEPHKRTAHLVRWWSEAETSGRRLPMLHLIGNVPPEVQSLLENSKSIAKRPFLTDDALQAAYRGAKALVLPSEIEGFGLPALEAYYLGTPVCYVRGTSVEEILAVATNTGGFDLDDPSSLFRGLDEVLAMSGAEVRACGLRLRESYAAEKVAARMLRVFEEVSR